MLKTVSSITNAIGALNYKGTWNASTNSPALASGVGTKGDYYVVSVAGSTNLDGETLWGVGDWAAFNGTVWQKVDGGSTGNFTTVNSTQTASVATASGNLNVGATTGTAKLNVVGAYDGSAPSVNSTIHSRINNGGAISLWTSGNAYSYMWTQAIQDDGSNNLKNMVLQPLGAGIGIGLNPGYQFEVSTDSAAKPSTNTWTIASDSRVKTVIGEYTKGVDAICSLRPVLYRYNGKAGFIDDGKDKVSIIAQEAMSSFPDCVGSFMRKLHEDDQEETQLFNWNGHEVTFALINSVKELKAEIDSLKSEIASIKGV